MRRCCWTAKTLQPLSWTITKLCSAHQVCHHCSTHPLHRPQYRPVVQQQHHVCRSACPASRSTSTHISPFCRMQQVKPCPERGCWPAAAWHSRERSHGRRRSTTTNRRWHWQHQPGAFTTQLLRPSVPISLPRCHPTQCSHAQHRTPPAPAAGMPTLMPAAAGHRVPILSL